jgi:hypothetical protein
MLWKREESLTKHKEVVIDQRSEHHTLYVFDLLDIAR